MLSFLLRMASTENFKFLYCFVSLYFLLIPDHYLMRHPVFQYYWTLTMEGRSFYLQSLSELYLLNDVLRQRASLPHSPLLPWPALPSALLGVAAGVTAGVAAGVCVGC